jgi:dolichyl-phosphate-mannose--protein O-mannosyl transferase
MGNPAIWWCSIPALVLIGAELVRRRAKIRNTWQRKDYVLLFIIISFLLQWLLYALIPRILFIYHFIANVPFMIFALTYWLNELWLNPNHPTPKPLFTKERVIKRVFVLSYLILTALLFFFFYPVISGFPVSYEYKEQLRWLSGWTF